ncbi:MAG: hypothetical protein JO124_05365 [Hyphomicrobiales bacterium]|nr:hypothetical protein [Hyphomicrobiales bacterium]MBV9753684.1 hypothetical protein [Hyphomicrobiales bacterium]
MRAAGRAAAKVKKGRLPSLSNTTIAVTLDPIELGALEVWISDQPDPKPSRQEAVRRLINEALRHH